MARAVILLQIVPLLTNRETRIEVVILIRLEINILRLVHFEKEKNNKGLSLCLATIDEVHNAALA